MSSASSPLLDFRDVSRSFTVRQGVLGRVRGEVRAVDGVSLSVRRGETLGLVGESGCGKSTLARMAVRLLPPTGGEILFDGESVLPGVSGRNDTWYSRRLQMIFQDPFSSLNPRLRIGTSIAEPLILFQHRGLSWKAVYFRQIFLSVFGELYHKEKALPGVLRRIYPYCGSCGS